MLSAARRRTRAAIVLSSRWHGRAARLRRGPVAEPEVDQASPPPEPCEQPNPASPPLEPCKPISASPPPVPCEESGLASPPMEPCEAPDPASPPPETGETGDLWPRRHQRRASSLRTPRLAVADADRAARPGLASSGAECGPTRAPQPRRPRPARQSASPQAHATTACPGPRANACRSSASRVWLAAAAAQLRYDDARRGYRDATPPRCGPEHECWRSTSRAPRTSALRRLSSGLHAGVHALCTRQTSRAARTAADAVALRLERLRPLAASHGFAS